MGMKKLTLAIALTFATLWVTAQTTFNNLMVKTNLTVGGIVTFSSNQPLGNATTPGVVVVSSSVSSTSTNTVASSAAVKAAYDLAAASTSGNFKVTTSGLIATIGSGTIQDAIGNNLTYSGGTAALAASVTNYLCISMYDGTVHCLQRDLDRGFIFFASAICDGSGATSVKNFTTIAFPQTRIPKFKAAMARTSTQLSVALLGDSLTQQSWRSWLLLSAFSSFGQNYPGASHTAFTPYSGGGQGAVWGLAMLGKSIAKRSIGSGQDYVNTGSAMDNYNGNFFSNGGFNSTASTQESPILTQCPNLLILENFYNQFNTGTSNNYHWGAMESICRKIVRANQMGAGIEVVMFSPGSGMTNNLADRWEYGYQARAQADTYGFEFVDIAALNREQINLGNNITSDGVHPNGPGNTNYCKAFNGVFNSYTQAPAPPVGQIGQRIFDYADAGSNTNYNPIFAESCDLQFTPDFTDALITNTSLSAFTNSQPAILFGAKSTANACYQVDAGHSLGYSHHLMGFAGMMIEPQAATATYVFTVQGVPIGVTNTVIAAAANNCEYLPGPTMEQLAAINVAATGTGFPGYWYNTGFTFTVLTGSINVIGAAMFGPEYQPIPWNRVELWSPTNSVQRAWARGSTSGFSRSGCVTTDFLGDFFVVPDLTGSGVSVMIQQNPAGRIIDLYLDGVFQETLDTYSAGGVFFFQRNYLFHTQGQAIPGFARGRHTLAGYLRSANGSATASTSAANFLKLVRVDQIN